MLKIKKNSSKLISPNLLKPFPMTPQPKITLE